MQIPLIPFAGFEHNFCKGLVGPVGQKQIFAVVATVEDVIAGILILPAPLLLGAFSKRKSESLAGQH